MAISEVFNMDCMEGMKKYPDGHFSLAIVDPPYGSDNIIGGYTSNKGGGVYKKREMYDTALWDQKRPEKEYFDELFRVSKNQIIWGANHFISLIPIDASCWIVWDKDNFGNFADCELAWTSFDSAVRKFKFRWSGMLQENMKNKEMRIHPTQKPVALYRWLLEKYGNGGGYILDTHLGSGSSRIAAYDMGFDFVGFELHKGYYDAQEKRFKNHIAQQVMHF